MNEAQELIRIVESRGGRLTIEGEKLVIEPLSAALPLADSLRTYKPEIVALLQSRTAQETESDALGLWMLARCVYRDRSWGGVGALYLDLARWCAEQGRPVPASRRAFTAELQAEGFAVSADGLVYGLMLREDAEACERSIATLAASETPAQPKAAKLRKAGRGRA
ncbi:MAG: hypothetical protein P4K93_09340 [Terracidiphilus sp.]|nr:hypothetical protein [Terracidiphilus sp.]MDR3798344.1 hypothetical protein [Terracidiphilus sp.]